MHASRMRTACLLTISHSIGGGGYLPKEGVSQHAIGQTPPWTEWQTGVKTLPCLKLRLWTVKILKLILRFSRRFLLLFIQFCHIIGRLYEARGILEPHADGLGLCQRYDYYLLKNPFKFYSMRMSGKCKYPFTKIMINVTRNKEAIFLC